MDMWARLDRPGAVFYDITWTGYCGAAAPSEIQNVFEIVRDARDRAIQRVQDAVSHNQTLHGFEVDDAARGYIREKGFGEKFIHRTGHSIGEEVHGTGANMDNLETHDDRRIIPETCFSVEPGIYLPDFGIRSEVNVYVGRGKARGHGRNPAAARNGFVTSKKRISSNTSGSSPFSHRTDRNFRLDRGGTPAYPQIWQPYTLWSLRFSSYLAA